jgi:hypothetical protein
MEALNAEVALTPFTPKQRRELEEYAAYLDEMVRRLEAKAPKFPEKYIAFKAKYRNRPDLFMDDCVTWPIGGGPTEYQREAAIKLVECGRVSYRSAHGSGKTATAAILVLWFALTRDGDADGDWKIPTTAGSWRQLTAYLWPEIHLWSRRLRWDVIGRAPFNERTELLNQTLKLSTGQAFALASDRVELIEGAHAFHLMYILDEAKAIAKEIWTGIEGAFSMEGTVGEALAFCSSTPGAPQGTFYDIQSRKPGTESWHVIFVTFRRILKAGRISLEWAKQRKLDWGEKSAVFQNRVMGEFAVEGTDGIIPLSWLEAANDRWRDFMDALKRGEVEMPPFTCVGADVGRSLAGDPSTVAKRYGGLIESVERRMTPDVTMLQGWVQGILEKFGKATTYAVVDIIGIGAGAVDNMRAAGFKVFGHNASVKTAARDKTNEFGFTNIRAQGWWNLRELLAPDSGADLMIPPVDTLTGDLVTPKYRMTSTGLRVQEKDEIRAELGRSPDEGDAVVHAFFPVQSLQGDAGRIFSFYARLYAEKQKKETEEKAKREHPDWFDGAGNLKPEHAAEAANA